MGRDLGIPWRKFLPRWENFSLLFPFASHDPALAICLAGDWPRAPLSGSEPAGIARFPSPRASLSSRTVGGEATPQCPGEDGARLALPTCEEVCTLSRNFSLGVVALVLGAWLGGCGTGDDKTVDRGKLHPPGHDGEGGSSAGGSGGTGGRGGSGGQGGIGGTGGLATGGNGGGGSGGQGGTTDPAGPWPVVDVIRYGPESGLPSRVTGVGVDDAQNVYVTDGTAVYAMPTGSSGFVRSAGVGQFATGHMAFSICGGGAGRVYVGYLTYEKEPELLTEDEKLLGDMDRFALQPDGTLALEFHHRLQNSNAKWMDHTRSILSCARVVGGPNHGDLYVGSNHGVTIIRGDDYADHRHSLFIDSTGSQAIGYVWAANTDTAGHMLFAGHWKLAAVELAPLDDVMGWIDYTRTPWFIDTHAEVWGPVEDPDDLHAIAGDVALGRVYVGSWGKGLAAMNFAPRRWWQIEGTPDTHINSLELDPTDGKLWVGTRSAGLWRWDPARETWEAITLVPSETIFQVYLDTTVTPRAVYVAAASGLYVIRAK